MQKLGKASNKISMDLTAGVRVYVYSVVTSSCWVPSFLQSGASSIAMSMHTTKIKNYSVQCITKHFVRENKIISLSSWFYHLFPHVSSWESKCQHNVTKLCN